MLVSLAGFILPIFYYAVSLRPKFKSLNSEFHGFQIITEICKKYGSKLHSTIRWYGISYFESGQFENHILNIVNAVMSSSLWPAREIIDKS